MQPFTSSTNHQPTTISQFNQPNNQPSTKQLLTNQATKQPLTNSTNQITNQSINQTTNQTTIALRSNWHCEAASLFGYSILRVLPFGVGSFCCCWYLVFPSDFPSWSVMWLTTVYRFIIYTFIMLTTAHADRGRPTLKDDKRFQHGLVRDLQELFITVLLCPTKKGQPPPPPHTAPLEIHSPSKRLSSSLVYICNCFTTL